MSIFGNIASAIFGSSKTKTAPGQMQAVSASAAPPLAPGAEPGKPISRSELDAMIAKLADEQDEDLNWNESIVDLMKLLKLDSSLNARKQLAQELGYSGALDGSAAMNTWLHQQVMLKLVEGGGKVPESLKHA